MSEIKTLFTLVEEPKTKCKHRKGECKKCSSTNKRDTIHTTKNGEGCVRKLFKK